MSEKRISMVLGSAGKGDALRLDEGDRLVQRIRYLRVKPEAFEQALNAKALTGVALARLLDIHWITISRVRSGGLVKKPLAIAIATTLGEPLEALFESIATAEAA